MYHIIHHISDFTSKKTLHIGPSRPPLSFFPAEARAGNGQHSWESPVTKLPEVLIVSFTILATGWLKYLGFSARGLFSCYNMLLQLK